jgi:hypothetical protein
LEAGIELHFVSLRCVLKPNHSFVDLLQVEVEIDRATSEAAAKSERLTKVWAQKKHSAAGIAITKAMPVWLEGRVGESIRVNEEKAKTVRSIFRMAADGLGKRLITRRLNEGRVPPFSPGKRWAHSTVQRILFNRAVLGEYQPYKGRPGRKGNGTKPNGESLKRVRDGEPRLDFFPAIVSPDLWSRAHASIDTRRSVNKKGQVTSNAGDRNGAMHNLFAGLLRDGNMNLPMHWQDKG